MSNLIQAYLDELEVEAGRTQKVLEAVPADKLDWRPASDKAMTLGQLALHVAGSPSFAVMMISDDSFDMGARGEAFKTPADKEEILAAWQQSLADMTAAIKSMDEARAMSLWTVKMGDQEIMSMPRIGVVRHIMINHMIHHRGQLTADYRCVDTFVPATYGMSADDNPFAEAIAAAEAN